MTDDVEIIEEDRPSRAQKWSPGQSGNAAGRPKGIRQPVDVRERCEALACDPFRVLAMIANGDYEGLQVDQAAITLGSRLKAATELASYIAPKLKSIEVQTSDKEEKTVYVVSLPASGRENDTLEDKTNELATLTPTQIADQLNAVIHEGTDES